MARKDVDDPAKAAAATFNMTPMIDVVFQLIVVFLCSMKFRTLDQKIEAFLPKTEGVDPNPIPPEVRPTLDLRLVRKGPSQATRLYVAGSGIGEIGEGDALWERLRATAAEVRAKSPDVVGQIDASPEVEHGDVVRALDTLVAAGLGSVKFRGTPLARR